MLSIEDYHFKLFQLIYSIYRTSDYEEIEIIIDSSILARSANIGDKIDIRYKNSNENIDNPANWFIFNDYVSLIVNEQMDDLSEIESLIDSTSVTENYPLKFHIKLPEALKFFHSLLGWISILSITVKTNK